MGAAFAFAFEKKRRHRGRTASDGSAVGTPRHAREQAGAGGLPLYLQRSAVEPSAAQTRLGVGAPDDAFEREADHAAARVVSNTPRPAAQRKCACGGAGGGCEACGQAQPKLQRRTTGNTEAVSVPSSVHETVRSAGEPLDAGTRAYMETGFGHDFGRVRVHADTRANETARAISARAYTVGNDVVFGAGQFQPHTSEGRHLIAHELAHVIQQGAAPNADGALIQRAPEDGGVTPAGNNAAAVADAAANAEGPCGVVASTLSNAGLLLQLNRARVYLTQHQWGEGETYDYENLLRRLSAERRRRVEGGHVWLAESGLLHVPEELYALEPGGGLRLTVRRVPGSTAAGAFAGSPVTLMTRVQFERFLARHNAPVIDAESYFASLSPDDPLVATLNLPEQTRRRMVSPIINVDMFGRPLDSGLFPPTLPYSGGGLLMPTTTSGMTDPFGLGGGSPFGTGITPSLYGDATMGRGVLNPYPHTYAYTPSSQELLQDVRSAPGAVTPGGPERVFLPRPSPSQMMTAGGAEQPFIMPPIGQTGYPEGVGALGFLGRPGIGLPQGTTGVMWEGAHVTDIVVMNERLFGRGFRAPLATHAQSSVERSLMRGGGSATAQLNVGTPGSYAIDATFPYSGELLGRGIGHWGRGAVAIVRADGTPVQGAELMRLMAEASRPSTGSEPGGMGGRTYSFSTPPEGHPAYERAAAEAERRGIGNWCQRGGTNCINVPADIHSQALGGVELAIPGPNGETISLRDPAHASAENMSRFMQMPDSFFEERGLRRVNIGAQQWRGVGVSAGLGVGASLASDAWRMAHGEDAHFVRNALISGGSNVVSVVAEDVAYTGMTSAMMRRGVSAGTASTFGRLGASSGVGALAAPVVTGLEMAFDDQPYTRIDYAARMSRSGLAGGGGALASGLFFAACGSEVPLAGNIVGFVVGIAGYYITDALAGEEAEALIREGMGEGGCTGGVGPGR